MAPSKATTRNPDRTAIHALCVLAGAWLLLAHAHADQIVRPSLGRPVFSQAGQSILVHAFLEQRPQQLQAFLVRERPYRGSVTLEFEPGALEAMALGRPIRLNIPSGTPRGTYDLELRCDGRPLRARHCVAVGPVPDRIRVAHVADPQLTPVGLDPALVDEINVLAPTAILISGRLLPEAARGDAAAWRFLVEQLVRFDAPVVVAGEESGSSAFSKYIAASPVDLIPVGRHRFMLLNDQPESPLQRDREQLAWIDREVARGDFQGVTLVATQSGRPTLLEVWEARGQRQQRIREGRIGLWFSGSAAPGEDVLLSDLPVVAIQEPARMEQAPRFRVFDISSNGVLQLGAGGDPRHGRGLHPGAIQVQTSGGGFEITNRHPFGLSNLELSLLVPATGSLHSAGARLLETLPTADATWCRVRVSVPAFGTVRGLVGTTPSPPPIVVRAGGNVGNTLILLLENPGKHGRVVIPEVRLGRHTLRLQDADGRPLPPQQRIPLGPGGHARLRVDLAGVRVDLDSQSLQVYLHGGPVLVPQSIPLQGAGTTQAGVGDANR